MWLQSLLHHEHQVKTIISKTAKTLKQSSVQLNWVDAFSEQAYLFPAGR